MIRVWHQNPYISGSKCSSYVQRGNYRPWFFSIRCKKKCRCRFTASIQYYEMNVKNPCKQMFRWRYVISGFWTLLIKILPRWILFSNNQCFIVVLNYIFSSSLTYTYHQDKTGVDKENCQRGGGGYNPSLVLFHPQRLFVDFYSRHPNTLLVYGGYGHHHNGGKSGGIPLSFS